MTLQIELLDFRKTISEKCYEIFADKKLAEAFYLKLAEIEDDERFKKQENDQSKYEYHYDYTDCIWYTPGEHVDCPITCNQYREGWNDAMNYIFKDGKGYRPYVMRKKLNNRKEK